MNDARVTWARIAWQQLESADHALDTAFQWDARAMATYRAAAPRHDPTKWSLLDHHLAEARSIVAQLMAEAAQIAWPKPT